MENQQGPTIWHRELCSMLWGSLDGRGVWKGNVLFGGIDKCLHHGQSANKSSKQRTTLQTSRQIREYELQKNTSGELTKPHKEIKPGNNYIPFLPITLIERSKDKKQHSGGKRVREIVLTHPDNYRE